MTIRRSYFALAALAAMAVFAPAQGAPDFSKVEIKANKLAVMVIAAEEVQAPSATVNSAVGATVLIPMAMAQ